MTDRKGEIPSPGTAAALLDGCTCPVIDNEYGKGYMGQAGVFVYTEGCPVHIEHKPDSREEQTAEGEWCGSHALGCRSPQGVPPANETGTAATCPDCGAFFAFVTGKPSQEWKSRQDSKLPVEPQPEPHGVCGNPHHGFGAHPKFSDCDDWHNIGAALDSQRRLAEAVSGANNEAEPIGNCRNPHHGDEAHTRSMGCFDWKPEPSVDASPEPTQTIAIESRMYLGPQLQRQFSDEKIKNEPMLHRCTAEFARIEGGPLTHAFLDLLGEWAEEGVLIDSRSHMLMPTWFPAIPGYHHDDVPRSLSTGQPNYLTPEYRSEHAMLLVNAECAPTEFALGSKTFALPDPNEITYKVWHPQVMSALESGELELKTAPDKQIVFFDDRAWHQAVQAKKRGWRWFIRATRHSKLAARNEVRKQVQVYLKNPMEGW